MKERVVEVRRVNVKTANRMMEEGNKRHEHWEPMGPSGGAVMMQRRRCGHPEWAREEAARRLEMESELANGG